MFQILVKAMADERREIETEPNPNRYMFFGLVFGLGFMAVNVNSLGVSTSVPLFVILTLLALFSTFGIQAGAVKLGSASIGMWLGSVFVFIGAFMINVLSEIGYCQ